MDQAWALEEEFWQAVANGQPQAFYREHMVADGFVVMPNRIASRGELVTRWEQIAPARRCEISDPEFTVIEGGNLVITYRVSMDAEWIGDYEAFHDGRLHRGWRAMASDLPGAHADRRLSILNGASDARASGHLIAGRRTLVYGPRPGVGRRAGLPVLRSTTKRAAGRRL
jgi:hypothetical protein